MYSNSSLISHTNFVPLIKKIKKILQGGCLISTPEQQERVCITERRVASGGCCFANVTPRVAASSHYFAFLHPNSKKKPFLADSSWFITSAVQKGDLWNFTKTPVVLKIRKIFQYGKTWNCDGKLLLGNWIEFRTEMKRSGRSGNRSLDVTFAKHQLCHRAA